MAWTIAGTRAAFEGLRGELARAAREGRELGELRQLEGLGVYLKGSALRGRASVRHGVRRVVLRRPAPRLCEFANLRWLRSRRFLAPEPIAAGVLYESRLPRYQFLVTREVEGAVGIVEHLQQSDAAERVARFRELGMEVARMHAEGFVHRDLFTRNLLVRAAEGTRRVVFLDAWRGGARRQLRGPAYDLGCVLLDFERVWTEEEREGFWRSYLEGRETAGSPADRGRLQRAAERERERRRRRRRV